LHFGWGFNLQISLSPAVRAPYVILRVTGPTSVPAIWRPNPPNGLIIIITIN